MDHASTVYTANETPKTAIEGRRERKRMRASWAPTFYLLYRLPRLAVKGLHNQQLEGVIHKSVLHIRQKEEEPIV